MRAVIEQQVVGVVHVDVELHDGRRGLSGGRIWCGGCDGWERRELGGVSVGEDESGEKSLDFGATFEVRGAGYGKNCALRVGACGDRNGFPRDDGEIDLRVESIAGLGSAHPDGSNYGEFDSGSGGENGGIGFW